MNVFHVTRCIAAPRAYGGFNRSQQILEILSRRGIECSSIDLFANDFGDRVGNLRAGLALAFRARYPGRRSYSRVWTVGHFYRLLAAAVAQKPAAQPVLIWENTGDELLAYAASQLGLKVVALPHDLVTLNRSTTQEQWPALAQEVRSLGCCDLVYSISEEERWLLRLLGCPASYLPYFPPTKLEAALLRTRAERHPATDAPILLLGSISNPQTRAGLEHQLRLLRDAGVALGRRVVLAGNGTQELAPLAGPGIEVRGAVSETELSSLMAESAVLWTYQIAGTGALTRIVEALLAGLPVAGGGVALRSTGHLAGVYPIETVAELRALLPTLPITAALPARPVSAEEELVSNLLSLA